MRQQTLTLYATLNHFAAQKANMQPEESAKRAKTDINNALNKTADAVKGREAQQDVQAKSGDLQEQWEQSHMLRDGIKTAREGVNGVVIEAASAKVNSQCLLSCALSLSCAACR